MPPASVENNAKKQLVHGKLSTIKKDKTSSKYHVTLTICVTVV